MTGIARTGFSYEVLAPDVRELVQTQTDEIRQIERQAVFEIGRRLAAVRDALADYDLFKAYVAEEHDFVVRTAELMIRAYETFKDEDPAAVRLISKSARYLLSAPSTPQGARDEALAQTKRGEKVSHRAASQMVDTRRRASAKFSPANIKPPKPEQVEGVDYQLVEDRYGFKHREPIGHGAVARIASESETPPAPPAVTLRPEMAERERERSAFYTGVAAGSVETGAPDPRFLPHLLRWLADKSAEDIASTIVAALLPDQAGAIYRALGVRLGLIDQRDLDDAPPPNGAEMVDPAAGRCNRITAECRRRDGQVLLAQAMGVSQGTISRVLRPGVRITRRVWARFEAIEGAPL
jgi:hypothetical protein